MQWGNTYAYTVYVMQYIYTYIYYIYTYTVYQYISISLVDQLKLRPLGVNEPRPKWLLGHLLGNSRPSDIAQNDEEVSTTNQSKQQPGQQSNTIDFIAITIYNRHNHHHHQHKLGPNNV